jgi:predicted Ser/Thr protein kinase
MASSNAPSTAATPTDGIVRAPVASRFGAYEILHELKSGGMGAVLLGRRRGPGTFEQLVAIKTIRTEYAGVQAVREMFLDEAAILARLNHPGVANVFDFGEDGGSLYMVMEYVAGIPFRELPELRPQPIVIARAIVEACRGLHAAHELHDLSGQKLGLVHRDISPDNLMLGFDGHVKVIDFGIALVKNRQAPVTEFGTVKGKPPYMSPEQVKNEAMDRRSDVFSLAIVLWELLTGRPLFDGDSIYAVARAVEHGPIRPPSQVIGEALPLGLDAAVMNALDRDVARRTPTAAAFAEQLEQVLQAAGGESLEAWAEHALRERRDRHRAWLATVAGDGPQLPKAVGRASGAVTELGPLGIADTRLQLPAVAPVASGDDATRPDPSTSIGGTEVAALDVPPRRRIAPIVVGLLVLLAGGTATYLAMRPRAPAVGSDAAVTVTPPADAMVVDASDRLVAVDAGELPVVIADAPLADAPIDAGHRHGGLDAGHAIARDASIVTMPPDAAPSAVVGTGFVNITNRPGSAFLNIVIDGKPCCPTPQLHRKIAAGHHTIQLTDPASGEVVYTETIDVEDARSVSVTQP